MAIIMVAGTACGKKEPAQTSSAQTPAATEATQTETATENAGTTQTEPTGESQAQTEEVTTQAATEAATQTEETTPAGPVYYTWDDIEALTDTENFSHSAIEHIFNGSVNSSGNGSGYHYDMVEGSDGEIIPGTRSEEDKNGLYTANVEVDGHRKNHYSTFFPDNWSPQQVVDAINIAREDAMKNDRHQGTTWIGYYEDIEIDFYLDSKDRIVSAFPVYEDDRH